MWLEVHIIMLLSLHQTHEIYQGRVFCLPMKQSKAVEKVLWSAVLPEAHVPLADGPHCVICLPVRVQAGQVILYHSSSRF